jgi:hypothetical protein
LPIDEPRSGPGRVAAPGAPVAPGRRPSTVVAALAVALLLAGLAVPAWARAANGAKVVIVVGPVAALNGAYKDEAHEVADTARRYTSNVVLLFTPRATWSRVKDATRGASVLVYFGHGWGHPSPYGPFDPDRQNGMALDPASGADGRRRIYYGEERIRRSIRLAPGAAVLLYRLCYASGNTEPGLSEGATSSSKRRADGYGRGFLDAGAGIVFADGHPGAPGNYVRQLFATDRSMWQVFRSAPNFHRHILGPYSSRGTPGARYALDPDHGGGDPSGFYRSVVGDLDLRTTEVTGRVRRRARRQRHPTSRRSRSPRRRPRRPRRRPTSRRPPSRPRSRRRSRPRTPHRCRASPSRPRRRRPSPRRPNRPPRRRPSPRRPEP